MKNKETFEEYLSRMTGGGTTDLAALLFYQSIYTAENQLNPRRAIMRIKKALEAYKLKGENEKS